MVLYMCVCRCHVCEVVSAFLDMCVRAKDKHGNHFSGPIHLVFGDRVSQCSGTHRIAG